MTTLDKHMDVSLALALELEGAAIMEGVSTEELLRTLLDKWGKKVRRTRQTESLKDYIRERNAEGATDTEIAREAGLTQQAVSDNRAQLGLAPNRQRKEACIRGHAFTQANTYYAPGNLDRRECKKCRTLRDKAR